MLHEDLKALIAAKLSPDEIMDILGWTSYELVDYIAEAIEEYETEFKQACA